MEIAEAVSQLVSIAVNDTMKTPELGKALSTAERIALASLVANARFELIPLAGAEERAAMLPTSTIVTVTASPRLGIEATLALAERLSRAGYEVVPHLAARQITDHPHLGAVLDRMRAAGLRRAFIVGGDGPAIGEFQDGLALLRALQDRGHPFEELGVPCYPEGHVSIPEDVVLRDLRDKQVYAQAMTTQMSFNPRAVTGWIVRIRAAGFVLPIHLGVPGLVELPKLTRIATRIGVGDSLRYLFKNRGLLGHLVRGNAFGPDAFLTEMAPTLADPAAAVRALHVFSMNQVAETMAWQRRMLDALHD